MAMSMVPQTEVQADGTAENVTVSISKTGISIGNDHISREFTIKNRHINTGAIVNKRMDGGKTIEMQDGSEDFAFACLMRIIRLRH